MALQVEMYGRKTVVREPHCMLMMPGDYSKTVPLSPCNELYFVLERPERIFGGRSPKRRDFGLFFPRKDSPFFEYIETFKKLLETPVSPALCTQLDCLALAILAETFYNHNSGRAYSPIEQIEGYINNHYSMPLDFQALAQRFGLSFSTFRKLWSERHELPPGATVMNLRNRHARELLLTSTLGVGEIAALIGYPDARYFSRFFRRMNGLTPGEFRKQMSEKEI